MATVELRGPCNLLAGKLDIETRRIEKKCPRCTEQNGGNAVYHWFDAETGELVDDSSPVNECHPIPSQVQPLPGP